MSRNLCRIDCHACGAAHEQVQLTGPTHKITAAEAGIYFETYEGMLVANAECMKCRAQYLAWIDMATMRKPAERTPRSYERYFDGNLFFDLSYRSSFNDEPGVSDMSEAQLRERITELDGRVDELRERSAQIELEAMRARSVYERRFSI